ncbi:MULTISPECIES: hypothetical protein [unclassified Sedimentibacter]|uniref:hypothetical protein n=1 Tax=unclassified Sedimentibacter TaxID=2649220 RepID=UPI0027DF842E|nr:hypothetical protein [Sedimentibacter sp. MB35-C1]WMJ76790.1 hypothetical protein RBQ61_14610 [Sedimentibacter sp. MB35-C1]
MTTYVNKIDTYYIRLKDENGNYYDDGTIYLDCYDPYLHLESNGMPQDVCTNISSLPFDMTLSGADGNGLAPIDASPFPIYNSAALL